MIFLGMVLFMGSISCRTNSDYDSYALTLQWGAAMCNEFDCYDSHWEKVKAADAFTLHGLWPQRSDGSWPQYCDHNRYFDESDLAVAVKTEMEDFWFSLSPSCWNQCFWKHQWEKHGTCVSSFPEGTNNPPISNDYFETALRLRNQYPLLQAFKEAGVFPGNTYQGKQYSDAFKNKYGKRALFKASNSEGLRHLKEVTLCFNKDLILVDCRQDWKYYPDVAESVHFTHANSAISLSLSLILLSLIHFFF